MMCVFCATNVTSRTFHALAMRIEERDCLRMRELHTVESRLDETKSGVGALQYDATVVEVVCNEPFQRLLKLLVI